MAATAVQGFSTHGVDTTSPKSKDVGEKSDSEPIIDQGVATSLEVADQLEQNWKEREKREGVMKWVSPFDTGAARPKFDTKKECQAHMNKTAKARIEQAKLEKKPKESYSPKRELISPKRTIADFVLPHHRDKYVAAQAAAVEVQKIGIISRKEQTGTGLTAGFIVGQPESQAIPRVKDLNNKELEKATHAAFNHSKKRLYRACQEECKKRGITVKV